MHHYAPPTAGIAQGKTCPIEASNIANLGTELEKKIKLAAAQTEQAWRGVGQRPGLQIWRYDVGRCVPQCPCVRCMLAMYAVCAMYAVRTFVLLSWGCRIEKFTVQAWPEKDYGRFYNGDSYILLHVRERSTLLSATTSIPHAVM